MSKHTILFLASNPLGTDRLALDEEARAIHAELERSGHRDQFELVTRWAVRPLDLLRELRKLKPTIVHFSGHGGGTQGRGGGPQRDVSGAPAGDGAPSAGLVFQGADGRPQFVSSAALEKTFGAAGSSVKLVVLNACYSEVQAAALVTHVDAVVGMAGAIGDVAARAFAIGFYGGLGEGESVAAAYRQGRAAMELDGLPARASPRLKARDAVEVERIRLATHRSLYGAPSSNAAAIGLYAAVDDHWRHRDRVRWGTVGVGAISVLSGGVGSVASQLPIKGVLGLLGAGIIVIGLALAFDRVPRGQTSGLLRFVLACVVVLFIGLAYACKVLFGAWGDYDGLRLSSAPPGNAVDASALKSWPESLLVNGPSAAEAAVIDIGNKTAETERQERALGSAVKLHADMRVSERVSAQNGDARPDDSSRNEGIEGEDLLADAKRFDEQVRLLQGDGKLREALELAAKAWRIREERLGRRNPETMKGLDTMAMLHEEIGMLDGDTGMYHDAVYFYESELQACEDTFGASHPDVSRILDRLAVLYCRFGSVDPRMMLGSKNPNSPRLAEKMAALYHRHGDNEKAASVLEALARVYDREVSGVKGASLRRRALELREGRIVSSE